MPFPTEILGSVIYSANVNAYISKGDSTNANVQLAWFRGRFHLNNATSLEERSTLISSCRQRTNTVMGVLEVSQTHTITHGTGKATRLHGPPRIR